MRIKIKDLVVDDLICDGCHLKIKKNKISENVTP